MEPDRGLNKRRVTDFVFQRLRTNEPGQQFPYAQPCGNDSQIQGRVRSTSSQGAPVVQASSPGAEFRDALQRRAARAQFLQQQKRDLSSQASEEPALVSDDQSPDTDAGFAKAKLPVAARRFHLSRNNLVPTLSKHSGGIRKHKHNDRAHLATFVEKQVDRFGDGELQSSNQPSAIDRLIHEGFTPHAVSVRHGASVDQLANNGSAAVEHPPQQVQPFVKAPPKREKTGHSIRDHPSTWDYDSDQLANELAAFALEISEEGNSAKVGKQHLNPPACRTPEIADTNMDVDDVYVYETYLRVHRSELSPDYDGKTNSIGMLVIEEQDEELWQTFAEDEEDSEWDEEDGDSNGMSMASLEVRLLTFAAEDNPRNDYPEDEVSSEDEHGHSAYKYHHGASDEEEYDLEDEPLSSDNEGEDL